MANLITSAIHHLDVVFACIVIVAIGIYAISATIYAFSFTSKKA
jgi:hypothetical protein